jgi:AcrR family transcriptional regulator
MRTGVRLSTEHYLPIVGEPPPERADAARNRERILTAVRDLLRTRTPCDISIDDIAARAGVGKGTVYRRFGDRGGLMQAVLDEREQAFQTAVLSGPPPLGPGAPAHERLPAFLCSLIDQLEEVGDLLAEVETGHQWATSPPQRFRRLHVAVLLHEARPELDAAPITDALLASLSAESYLHQRRTSGYDPERIKQAVRALACGLLRQ